MLKEGLEPSRPLGSPDFKSAASTVPPLELTSIHTATKRKSSGPASHLYTKKVREGHVSPKIFLMRCLTLLMMSEILASVTPSSSPMSFIFLRFR